MTKNIRLYSYYRMFSYDLFFYYVMSFFYLTTVKGLNVTQILLLSSAYPLYKIVLQIPCNNMAQKLGIRKSIITGNLFWVLGLITYILAPNIAILVVSDILFAIGAVLKQITEPAMLICSLKREKQEDEYNRIEGSGIGKYFYIETIASILAGFLFTINPHLPYILGTIMSIVSLILATQFEEVKEVTTQEYTSFRKYLSALKHSMKSVVKKKRLQALMLYSGIFMGFIGIGSCYYKNMLTSLGMSAANFGIVFALLTTIQGIACQRQYIVERKTRNKTLTWTGLSYTVIFILIGLLLVSKLETTLLIPLVIILLVTQKIVEGTYQISMNKYMVNFTTPNTITTVLTSANLFNNIGSSLVMFFGALVLDNLNMSWGYILVGSLGFIVISLILLFMKTRVGLTPEEYTEYLEDEMKVAEQ